MRKGRSLSARLIHAQGSGAHPRPQQSSHSSKPFSGRRPSRILPGASAERSASLITVTRAFSQQHPENRLNRHSTLGAGESEHSDMDSLDLSDPEVGAGAGGAYFSTEESLCADHWPPGGGRKSKTELGIITEVITEDVADIGQMNSYDFNP